MAQVVLYKKFQEVFILYRGGYDEYKKVGLDKYNREARFNGGTGFTVKDGCLIFPIDKDKDPEKAFKFFGLEKDKDNFVEVNLCVCFDKLGRMILFKEGTRTYRFTRKTKYKTKEYKLWSNEDFSKKSEYEYSGWKFKSENDYLISYIGFIGLDSLIPEYGGEYFGHPVVYPNLKIDKLWELNPICLNDSWDYNDDQKAIINEEEEKRRLEKEEYERQLEIQKNTPGYCEECGSPLAFYVPDPYDEDINNTINYRWLCDRCYNDLCGDI